LKREYALLGLLAALWGSSYLFIKVAVASVPPLTLVAMRVTIAALILVAVIRVLGQALPRDPATWRALFVQSVLNSSLAWALLAWGQQHIDSALAGVLNSTSPIFVCLLALAFVPREAPSRAQVAGALLGILGVALILGIDALRGLGREVLAQLAVLASAMLYGGAALHGRHLRHLPSAVTAAGTMLLAAAVLVPASLIVDRPWTLAPTGRSLLAALALGVFCTGCALLLYFRLIRTLGPLRTASQSYLRSGVSVLLGIVVLGEEFTPLVAAGLGVIIVGVALINLRAGRA
jgi:drug/metabolite transporter (DMT)-like permease